MFRRRKAERKLSAEELKTKLYSHLDKTGSISQMRTELREKLISELLKKAAPAESFDVNFPVYTFDRAVLPLQISNWLIYDHLLRQGYQYALSIFVTEANFPTHPEKLLAACDILVLLGLDSNSSEYKNISQMCSVSNAPGFSHSLLVAVIKCLFELTTREGKFTEKPVIKEEAESNSKIMHDASVKEKTFTSESLDFRDSSSLLRQRKGSADLSLHEQVQLLKEEKEKEIQSLRHKLLQELDRLHDQDHKQLLETEQLRNEMKKERDALFDEKEKLRQKELLLEKEYENKLERKTRELETDFISKIHTKEKDLENFKQKLHEKDERLNQMEMNFLSQQERYASLKRELDEMKHVYGSLQNKYSNLLDENTNLLKKFESMSDYLVLKGDLKTKIEEVCSLRLELEDSHKQAEKEREDLLANLRKVEAKLRTKEPELLEAQKQLNLTRDTLHMEETVWQKERKKLEQEVISSREMYQTLIQRIEEQRQDIQALHQTIHILHYQLTDKSTRTTARVEPFIPNRSSFFKTVDTPKRDPDVYRISRGTKEESFPKYRESSLKFIEEAKDRINKLQQEADDLQSKSSIIYSSAPVSAAQYISNPLTFSSLSEQRFQPTSSYIVKPLLHESPSSRFENLIHNELPTLDLSLPLHIKSQFGKAFADIYKPSSSNTTPPRTSNINIPKNLDTNKSKISEDQNKKSDIYTFTLFSDAPSLDNKQNVSTEHKNKIGVKYSANEANTTQVYSGDPCPKGVDLSDNYINEQSALNLPADLQIINDQKSPNASFKDTENEDWQSLQKNLTENIQNTSVETLKTTQINKTNESFPQLPTPAIKTNNKLKSQSELENENKIPSEVSKSLESADKKDGSAFQEKSETPLFESPIVVDLDAAWKRKSSLTSTSYVPLQSRKLSSEFLSPVKNTSSVDNLKSSQDETIQKGFNQPQPTNYQTGPNPSKPILEQIASHAENNNSEIVPSDNSKKVDVSKIQHESSTEQSSHQQELSNQSSKSQETKPSSEKSKQSILEKSKNINDNVPTHIGQEKPKDVLSDSKPAHDDSLSELNEIHLSCGSEQEQQKDDSDNW